MQRKKSPAKKKRKQNGFLKMIYDLVIGNGEIGAFYPAGGMRGFSGYNMNYGNILKAKIKNKRHKSGK